MDTSAWPAQFHAAKDSPTTGSCRPGIPGADISKGWNPLAYTVFVSAALQVDFQGSMSFSCDGPGWRAATAAAQEDDPNTIPVTENPSADCRSDKARDKALTDLCWHLRTDGMPSRSQATAGSIPPNVLTIWGAYQAPVRRTWKKLGR